MPNSPRGISPNNGKNPCLFFPSLYCSPSKLRATVVDLSDAVRGRASIWSMDGLSEHWSTNSDNDQSLEHVGLLEEIPHDSVCEWAASLPVSARRHLARFFS